MTNLIHDAYSEWPEHKIFDVYFENSYCGYAWASFGFQAIQKVAGDASICENGHRDYRWTAAVRNYP